MQHCSVQLRTCQRHDHIIITIYNEWRSVASLPINSKLRPNQQTTNDNSSGWADVTVRKTREEKKRQRNQLGTIDSRLCAQESEYEAVQPESAEFCRLVREEKEWRGVARTCPELPVQASTRL